MCKAFPNPGRLFYLSAGDCCPYFAIYNADTLFYPSQDAIGFANRVRQLICDQAGIKPVPWDGMLKYYRPSPRMCEKRRAEIAASFEALLTGGDGKKKN